MADIETSIAECCRQLRLSSNFAGQALTQKGDTPQEYLLNLLTNEIEYRLTRRKSKYLNTAGFLNILVRRNRLSGREETVCPVEWKP